MSSHADHPGSDVDRHRRPNTLDDVEWPSHASFVAVVGTPTDRDALRTLARSLGAARTVRVIDAVENDETPREARIRYADARRRGRLVVATDRPSAVDDADRIYVVADGGVVETGTHAELVRLRDAYARLYGDQFGQDWHRETEDVADE
ncbi:ABC transporter ATP-binding protein/permease [Halogeometricum limi]|nr:ABC transporter ATP-binding protein/permease [Halogeometricum limi]